MVIVRYINKTYNFTQAGQYNAYNATLVKDDVTYIVKFIHKNASSTT